MVITSNAKNKEKTKTLNKVIEQEAFSEGFRLLKNFCKKSTENPEIISDFVTEFDVAELSSDSKLSRVEDDGVKFVKIESAKFYETTSSSGKKRKFSYFTSKFNDEVGDRFEELLSELIDCYLKENPYAKFEMPNRTKVKVPYSSSSKSVYESSNKEVARWHICSFLNKFFVDLKKVQVNLHKKTPQAVFLALKQGKLTSDVDDNDDYLKLFTFDFKDLENVKLLEDYSWRGEENIVVESLVSSLTNNLKNLASDLLTNEYSLKNVLEKEIPLSILSDYQIEESLKNFQTGADISMRKLTMIRESSSSPEQFSRFMNILEKFIQDKFLE